MPSFTSGGVELGGTFPRLTRNFTVGRVRLQPQIDIYNLFNGNTVLGSNTRYGTSWLVPSAILDPRLLKFGVQVNF